MKSELQGLRARIAELAAQGVAIRSKIGAARERARYDLWNEKRAVGDGVRDLLLAYAFLRGVPYRVAEPTAREKPAWFGGAVETWRATWSATIAERVREVVPSEGLEARVLAWLTEPEPEAHKARREAAERRGRERALERARAQRAARKGAA